MKHSRSFALTSAFTSAITLLALACSTDNGETMFGENFGPNEKEAGSSSSSGSASGGSSSGSPGDDGGGSSSGQASSSGSNGDGGGDGGTTSCAAGTVAVLAGNDTTLSGAIQSKGGAWQGGAIAGGSALSRPALVAFGTGFLGAAQASGNVVRSTTYTTSWSAATTFGIANVKGPPTLAVAGTSAHVVYSAGAGMLRELTHGIHDGSGWNAADATVGTKPNHSFGTLGAGLAGVGTTVAFMENGTDHDLYTRVWDGGWSASSQVAGATSIGADTTAFPVIAEGAGKFDLVAIYSQETTRRLSWAARDGQSKAWQNGGVVHDFATTDEPFSVARVGQSTYLVAFRGQDGNGYYAQGTVDGGGAFTWNAAKAIGGGGSVAVDAPPSVAKGVCGDDAIVVFASAGQVKATRLRGTSWTPVESVTGASGARVAVATR